MEAASHMQLRAERTNADWIDELQVQREALSPKLGADRGWKTGVTDIWHPHALYTPS